MALGRAGWQTRGEGAIFKKEKREKLPSHCCNRLCCPLSHGLKSIVGASTCSFCRVRQKDERGQDRALTSHIGAVWVVQTSFFSEWKGAAKGQAVTRGSNDTSRNNNKQRGRIFPDEGHRVHVHLPFFASVVPNHSSHPHTF